MIQIFAVPISNFPHTELDRLLSFVSEEKKQRLVRFLRREDLIRGLIGDLLVRKIVSETFVLPVKDIEFHTNEYGKPCLSTPMHSFHFNISHSGDWVVCATDGKPVGIDVERIQEIDLQIARHFFAPEEYEFIETATDKHQSRARFYTVWTAKESYIKAIGKGLSLPLNSFSTVRDGNVEGLRLFDQCTWYLKTYYLDDEYSLAACGQNSQFCETIMTISLETLITFFLKDLVKPAPC